ncbi:tRNA (adenosine(37)-N6)-threonylcarbamoyltransferase complex ATPase subunit type 1 TsaE [Telmatospirillum sp. J64-1]|uniref:tRNA (adenosine(37)-N6)-threonylcarbamoyltransferase complex ATPase subunit type 1 TsaE n=1 Tax=Telmatospirillum sp. J64-1 TaxID=2502183 RepID=UPI00115E59BC|nr:tRNA (adenosine(37)-N6)-threonylcarbamoyltransferase complex ATPase subunit type 1 TsaE [Telmatospirillum sp. J64-1]
MDTDPFTLVLADEAATASLAARLAACVRPGDVIALRGDLGMGKTAFARAFVRSLAGAGEDVPSPTFTLVQVYDTEAGTIWHFDLYRLESPDDAWELDIEDAFADGISLIEWPDRLGNLLPAKRLDITLSPGDGPTVRQAELKGAADWPARLKELLGHD